MEIQVRLRVTYNVLESSSETTKLGYSKYFKAVIFWFNFFCSTSWSLHVIYIFTQQVLDPVPFQGLVVTPVQGIVPVGGKAELKIILSPNALIKFDTRIQVAIRGWKTLELRVGGSVEPPCVDIDLVSYDAIDSQICYCTCTPGLRHFFPQF